MMMSEEDWCKEQLANLELTDQRLSTLINIRDHLSNIPVNELKFAKNFLHTKTLLDLVNDSNKEQSTLACDIITFCMSKLDLNDMERQDINNTILAALSDSNPEIKMKSLKMIWQTISSSPEVEDGLDNNLILPVISCLETVDTEIGELCVKILSCTLFHHFRNPAVASAVSNMLKTRTEVRCRIYEIAINISKESPMHLQAFEPILERSILDLDGDDILNQLCVLELYVKLAEVEHGLQFLTKSRVLDKITAKSAAIGKNPIDALLVPGFIKFFSKMAFINPQFLQTYPSLVNSIFGAITSGDLQTIPMGYDSFANIAHKPQGKQILCLDYMAGVMEVLQEMRTNFNNLSIELKVRSLNALNLIFKTDEETRNQPGVIELYKTWYGYLTNQTTLGFIYDACIKPFPELRTAALTLLYTICTYPWGYQYFMNSPGFLEYLLDRNGEDKNSLFIKYDIIKMLAENPSFPAHALPSLQKYVAEGPLYVVAEVDVAYIEGH